MYNEPKQKNYALRDPSIKRSLEIAKKYQYKVSIKRSLEIAKKYQYKVEIMRAANGRAFLSVSEPFYKSPYPYHFTSIIRTARYVDAAFEKYNS